jgi:hypothetical protein
LRCGTARPNIPGGSDLKKDQFWFITARCDHAFEPGSVCQIKNPSPHQEIYGAPEYHGRATKRHAER